VRFRAPLLLSIAPPNEHAAVETTRNARASADFDGLRAIAVLAVVAFSPVARRACRPAYLGVDLFMVLSGYLINRVAGRRTHPNRGGRCVSAGSGYAVSARLVPALLAVLAGRVDLGAVRRIVGRCLRRCAVKDSPRCSTIGKLATHQRRHQLRPR